MQISIYVINNMPEPGRNLAADACMGRTQLSPCIYNFSTRTIRASRNAMPAWYFFHAEPLISRFSLEKYITLLQQLWQTVLMWNLYPILISLNQLAVKITPAESFLWMHLHQFQYLWNYMDRHRSQGGHYSAGLAKFTLNMVPPGWCSNGFKSLISEHLSWINFQGHFL